MKNSLSRKIFLRQLWLNYKLYLPTKHIKKQINRLNAAFFRVVSVIRGNKEILEN